MSTLHGSRLLEEGVQTATIVPDQLELLATNDQWVIGIALFFSFLLLACSKWLEESALNNAVKLYFSLGTVSSLQKFDMRLGSTGSVLLSINFLLSLWACLLLFVDSLTVIVTPLTLLWTALFAIGFAIYQLIGLFVVASLSGEYAAVRIPILQTLGGFQFSGILFFGIALVWFFNPLISKEMFYAFAFTFGGFYVLRTFKAFIGGLGAGISWYYIILYFCTLEILPLFVTYYYFKQNFKV